jgi:nucleotide-binding universal stress UspA family protein
MTVTQGSYRRKTVLTTNFLHVRLSRGVLEALDRATQEETRGIRRILVAFDGCEHDWSALDRAIDLAVEHSALLTIAVVVPDPRIYTSFGMMVLPCSPETLRRDAEREMLRLLAAARDEVPANVSLTTRLVHGRPRRTIAALADEGGYDVVITGRRPCRRLRRSAVCEVIR